MNVILMGYRGSGKTTVGRKLAEELWKQFVDVDTRIMERFGGASIAEIWAEHGEKAFRAMESKVARELCAGEDQVIALGGGTVMQAAGRTAVVKAADAVRIYLYCEAEELDRRIHADQTTTANRPALTQQGGGIEEIQAVLAKRDPVYRKVADVVFDVTHTNPDEAVRHLIAKFL